MIPAFPLGLLVGCAVVGLPVAPTPREKPLLKCEVRVTGKSVATIHGVEYTDYSPDTAVVTITNNSIADLDIGSQWGPDAFLDLQVKDPSGADVRTEPLSSRLSVQSFLRPKPYVLKPGGAYRTTVGLLVMVPNKKRVTGTYKVKAVYTFKDKEYASDWVEVKWFRN